MKAHTKTQYCEKCFLNFRVNVYQRHAAVCNGPKIKKVYGIDYDPNIGFKNGTREAWNKGLTKENNDSVKSASEKLKITGGGYRKNAGRGKKYLIKDSFGNDVNLQSSYEFDLSEILNELSIKWIRPSFLRYGNKKYFPDFYLIDLNLYLDPKNDYLIKLDQAKIDKVCEENKVKVLIISKSQITKEYLGSLSGEAQS